MFREPKSVIEKTFYSLLPMQIILVIVGSVNSIIDGVFASNIIGPMAMTAIALFIPVLKVLDTINSVFLGGSQILCGQYIGKNQLKKSSAIFSIDLVMIFSVGILVTLSCIFLGRPVIGALVEDPEMSAGLYDYVLGYSFGIVPSMFVSQLTSFLQIERQEKRTYVGMGVMIALNIILNALFIIAFDMGMLGLGLATTLSNVVYMIILLSFYIRKQASIIFSLKGMQLSDLKDIVRIGIPGALAPFCQAVRATLLNAIMIRCIGEIGVSVFSVINTFGCIYWALSAGVTSATRVLASIYTGEEDREGLREIVKTALLKGVMLVLCAAVLLIALAPLFTLIYFRPDAGEIYRMTLVGFLLFPVTMPLSCICVMFSNYYQCLERIGIVNILTVADGVVGVVLFSFLLVPPLGMNGLWLAHILNGVLTVAIVATYTFIYNKRFPKSLNDYLVLEDSFGVCSKDRIDINITDIKEVINLSQRVIVFASEHNIDHNRALFSGICVEEMTGNIVEHGFDGKKSYAIDVRVVYKDGSLLIRIKDNCKIFNPKEVADLFESEDICHNIGLRVASSLSKSMMYNNVLGLNVLTINM